jgi:hypothetical protein
MTVVCAAPVPLNAVPARLWVRAALARLTLDVGRRNFAQFWLSTSTDRYRLFALFSTFVALSLGCVTRLMRHASGNVQHATYGMQGRMKHAPYDMQHTRFHMQVHATSPAAGAGVAIGPWAARHGRPPQARLHQVTPRCTLPAHLWTLSLPPAPHRTASRSDPTRRISSDVE